jgi:hypothetical protein
MSTAWEVFLRTFGGALLAFILNYFANANNIEGILPAGLAVLVASIVAVVDKSYSQDGTVLFGTFGVRR